MAYYNDDQEEQAADPNAAPAQPGGQQGGVISGQGASGGSGPTAAAAPAPTAAAASAGPGSGSGSSPFVGIKQYLDANKSQSTKLAQDTAGVVNNATQQARDTLPKQTDLYNQAVSQNTVNLDQPLFNEAKTKAQNVANDAAKKANFVRMRDAAYAGPQDLQSSEFYQPVKQAYDTAATKAENTKTEQGQSSLLGDLQQQTRGKVNQSAINLDRMLLKGDEAKNILAKSVEGQADLPALLQAAQAQSQAKAADAKSITDATRSKVQSAFGGPSGVQSQLQKEIEARVAPLIAQGKKEADTLTKMLAGGREPTAAQYKQLGISPKQFYELSSMMNEYDKLNSTNKVGQERLNLSNYLRGATPGISAQQVANDEEYARYAALNSLMGTNNSFLTDPNKANSYSTDSIDLNYNKAKSSITQSLQALKDKIKKTADDAKQREKDRAAKTTDKMADDVSKGVGSVFGPVAGGGAGAAVRYAKKKKVF